MRADAVRNVDAILEAGARLLSEDPSATITAIAAEAGLTRRAVHRRFSDREALLDAVLHRKLDAVEAVLANARLDTAPIAVALHRFVEGIIEVGRRYPISQYQTRDKAEFHPRMLGQREQFDTFLNRAVEQGVIRSDLPDGLVRAQLRVIVAVLARKCGHIDPPPAADLAVQTLLRGIGV
jgi:AcrR family transcriptional regulator